MALPEAPIAPVEAPVVPVAGPKLTPHADRPHFIDDLLAGRDIGVSPEMRALTLMQNFAIDEAEFRAENAEEIARIMDLDPSRAFLALNKLMETAGGKKLAAYVENVLELQVPGGHPAFTKERALKANTKSLDGLETRSSGYETWLQLFGHLHDIKYAIMESYLNGPTAREQMHETARIEYLHFREIAAAVNELSLVWTQDSGSLMTTEQRQEAGFTDQMAAIRVVEPETNPRTFKEVPWAQAYPNEIAAVVEAYRKLAAALRELTAEGEDLKLLETKAHYYETIATAYETSTKEAFLKADALEPGQSLYRSDLPVHVATIETGYGADSIQRIPEATLWYPDAEAKDVNETAALLREDMARELQKLLAAGDFPDGTHETIGLVRKTSFLASNTISAGMGLYFKPAGQFLPNEAESRFEGGVSVTASLQAMAGRKPEFEEAAEALFGMSLDGLDPKKMMGHSVASHEFGHATGLTQRIGDLPGTYERLSKPTVEAFIEEWKATVAGMVLGAWKLYQNPEAQTVVTMDDLKQILKERAAGAGRYAKRRKAPSSQPYMRKSLMLTKVLSEEGIVIQKEGGEWAVDVSDEAKVVAVYQRLERMYTDLLHIYGNGTKEDLRDFLATHLQPCPASEYMFAKMDSLLPGGANPGAMTVEEMCTLRGEVA